MQFAAPALVLSARPHGETAAIVRLLTEDRGVFAVYLAGGRGSLMRPMLIPGNGVMADVRVRAESQLPFARLELMESRGPWLGEPLAAAGIGWATALTAAALPERNPYPSLYRALSALLSAMCHAPSARGWAGALAVYEALLLRELGYGGGRPQADDLPQALEALNTLGPALERYILADRRGDVMAARARLLALLSRMA